MGFLFWKHSILLLKTLLAWQYGNIKETFNRRSAIAGLLFFCYKMWYCRFYHILMLQHLGAWDLPFESPLKKLIMQAA